MAWVIHLDDEIAENNDRSKRKSCAQGVKSSLPVGAWLCFVPLLFPLLGICLLFFSSLSLPSSFYPHLRICFFFDLRKRGREGEKEIEKHQCERETDIDWLSPIRTPNRDQIYHLDMCPVWGRNLHPFGVQDNASTSQGSTTFFILLTPPQNPVTLSGPSSNYTSSVCWIYLNFDYCFKNILKALDKLHNLG